VYLLDDILISFKLQSEVSTMKRSMSVADIQSSSNGEVAVLEELEDIMFQVCSVVACPVYLCKHAFLRVSNHEIPASEADQEDACMPP
jgi:hypothetical protein